MSLTAKPGDLTSVGNKNFKKVGGVEMMGSAVWLETIKI